MKQLFMPPLRPPGAEDENGFLRHCIRCGKCYEACSHNSIHIITGFTRSHLTPEILPQKSPCQLCLKCAKACPTGALDPGITDIHDVKIGQAYILKDKCHNYTDGIMCMTCYDRCPLRGDAIVLFDGFTPAITKQCAGCGICAYVCPVDAIQIIAKSSKQVPLNSVPIHQQNSG